MDIRHDVLIVFDGSDHPVIEIPWMGSHEPDPWNAGLGHIIKQITESIILAQILAIGIDVLA